jgi:hypothetical protein
VVFFFIYFPGFLELISPLCSKLQPFWGFMFVCLFFVHFLALKHNKLLPISDHMLCISTWNSLPLVLSLTPTHLLVSPNMALLQEHAPSHRTTLDLPPPPPMWLLGILYFHLMAFGKVFDSLCDRSFTCLVQTGPNVMTSFLQGIGVTAAERPIAL